MPLMVPIGFFAQSYLLDTVSNASGAWSMRKLRSAYSGSSIRVRRSSDNAEQDIGFDGSGNLDTTSLASFVGSNSAFIVKFYDQVGTNHLAQATAGSQPRIVNAGANDTLNSKIAVNFDGTSQFIGTASDIISTANDDVSLAGVSTVYIWRGQDGSGAGWSIWLNPIGDNMNIAMNGNGNAGYQANVGSASGQGVFTVDQTTSVNTVIAKYEGGTNYGTKTVGNWGLRSSGVYAQVGVGQNTGTFASGKFQELIVFNVALDSTNAMTVMSNQRTAWGVP